MPTAIAHGKINRWLGTKNVVKTMKSESNRYQKAGLKCFGPKFDMVPDVMAWL